jgi:transcriptional repressor NrdR
MRCPKCGSLEDKVIDSREAKDGSSIRRRRECQGCSHRFTTYEHLEQEELRVIKSTGVRQPFDREKLFAGIKKACEKRPISIDALEGMVNSIVVEIEAEGLREVESRWLGAKVMQHLERIDHVAYVRYASVYREFQHVGEFIEEINSLGTRVPKNPTQQELFRKI